MSVLISALITLRLWYLGHEHDDGWLGLLAATLGAKSAKPNNAKRQPALVRQVYHDEESSDDETFFNFSLFFVTLWALWVNDFFLFFMILHSHPVMIIYHNHHVLSLPGINIFHRHDLKSIIPPS